jgi:pyridinium-3,5-bisthiocarboxylic acid mononucleotide nickel chelatase
MKIAYLDCFSGISGDMTLGALIDAGLDFKLLQRDLAGLSLDEYELYEQKVVKNGITGTKVQVLSLEGHVHRRLNDIHGIINRSSLPPEVKDKSMQIFTRLAESEAKIHGTTLEEVHFHEVGAVDAIVDIVGAVIGFWRLGIEKVFASSVHTGKGFVKAAHGVMPIPAPATLELLKGVPIYSRDIDCELVTPTGAAILTTYCQDFGPMPEMKVERIGYGAGEKNLSIPNLLRLTLGELNESKEITIESFEEGIREGKALTLEANIDDMNPEFYDYLIEKLFKFGAMDVYIQNIQMKKNRPANILTVQIAPKDLETIRGIIFEETTSIGLRVYPVTKYMLPYEITTVNTEYGSARVKKARFKGRICTVSPEYEDCRQLARQSDKSLKDVYDCIKMKALEDLD